MKAGGTIFPFIFVFVANWAAPVLAGPPQPIAVDQWITGADNLPEASRLGLDGTVSVELAVDSMGKVTGCRVVKSSGHNLLDEHSCRLLTARAQFKPATDKDGRAIKGTFSHAVTWQVVTNANWAANGLVRAEMVIDLAGRQMPQCTAEISGEISDYMKQMACFVLVNQGRNILATLEQAPPSPLRAALLLSVSPKASGDLIRASVKGDETEISYTSATVAISPSGMRSDCQMLETRGAAALLFPICGPTPPFRYVPMKDSAGANVATELRQQVAYYVQYPGR